MAASSRISTSLSWIFSPTKFGRVFFLSLIKITASLGMAMAVVFYLLHAPLPALAQNAGDANSTINEGLNVIQQPLGLPATDIRIIIANVIRVALGLLGIIFLIITLYAGYLWMTAGGNEEQIGSAKKMLLNGTIGIAIILSAYGIVTLVLRLLLGATQGGGEFGGGGVGAPGETNFQGSGALGGIIKDHYPARDAKEVPRNTKIIITFRRPIKMNSVVSDKNANGIFGDCVNIGTTMNWTTDCDALLLDKDHINITRADTNEPVSGAAVLATFENGKVFTVAIRPYDPLGSSANPIAYRVHIGNAVQLDDAANNNPTIFAGRSSGNDYYEWQFTTATTLDTAPPRVLNVFPDRGATEDKNSVIQITFNEAIDPTDVQGAFTAGAGADYYTLAGNSIFLKSGASTVPLGNFRITNGYRTLEFTPSKVCGQNACGSTVYCLPVCDGPGANCQKDSYQILVKAGQTFNANSFEAVPFSGVMDLSGNALDGNNNNKVDVVTSSGAVFPNQAKPDNYFWQFTINDGLDITAPYLKQITPGIDSSYVGANANWSLLFNKRMQVDPMYTIDIAEQPTQATPLCRAPRVTFNTDGTTLTTMEHCPFIDKIRHYYYPVIDSRIEDVHFNCFYPGKGPVMSPNNQPVMCDDAHPENCCAVDPTDTDKAFCCNGSAGDAQNCLSDLKANSL